MVLIASSPFFQKILKRNKHPHPLIYMRGVTPENLMAMVDFLYHGEANVYQENVDSLLVLAEELQLKGLRRNQPDKEAEVIPQPTKQKSPKYRAVTEQFPASKDVSNENRAAGKKTLALLDQETNNSYLESLDHRVKSMMTVSENAAPHGKGKARICKVCGKEGGTQNIINHIEANHITGISVPCGLCGSVFTSRNLLSNHKSRFHKSQ